MYQLARGILTNPADETRVTLVWGVNTEEDIFLRDQFTAFEKEFPGRFKAIYVVADPKPGSQHVKGFITRKVLEDAGINAVEEKNDGLKVLVCGPPGMEKALTGTKSWGGAKGGVLAEMGFAPGQIHKF
jgi:cytochrome-b5 reductase